MAECPKCGYVLQPFERLCPRCARTAAKPPATPRPRRGQAAKRDRRLPWAIAAVAGAVVILMVIWLAQPRAQNPSGGAAVDESSTTSGGGGAEAPGGVPQNESAPAAPVAGQGQTGGDAGTTPAGGGSSQQSAGTTYDGSWSGTTSEGNAISFSVSNGVITRLVVAITKQTAAASYTDTTSMWFTDPRQAPKISGSSFQAEGRGTSTTGDSSTRWTLSGSFSTPTSASGSIAARFVQGPTETVVGTSSVSWTASQG